MGELFKLGCTPRQSKFLKAESILACPDRWDYKKEKGCLVVNNIV